MILERMDIDLCARVNTVAIAMLRKIFTPPLRISNPENRCVVGSPMRIYDIYLYCMCRC